MPKYQWHSAYELSVPEIDGDHRTMLDLVNLVAQAAHAGKKQECKEMLSRLLAFSLAHFSREEQLLDSWGYGETDKHREYHASMYNNALDNFKKLDTVQEGGTLTQFCEEALAYLIDEVIRGDMKVKSFLMERGIASPGDGAKSKS